MRVYRSCMHVIGHEGVVLNGLRWSVSQGVRGKVGVFNRIWGCVMTPPLTEHGGFAADGPFHNHPHQ